MQPAPDERRKHARFPFDRDLEIWAGEDAEARMVRANDISAGGFSFVSDEALKVGQPIVLGLRDIGEFLVRATVRNVRRENGHYIVGAERVENG
jgi:hypothetical protein